MKSLATGIAGISPSVEENGLKVLIFGLMLVLVGVKEGGYEGGVLAGAAFSIIFSLWLFLNSPVWVVLGFTAFYHWSKFAKENVVEIHLKIINALLFFIVCSVVWGSPFVGVALMPLFLTLSLAGERPSWNQLWTKGKTPVKGQQRLFMSDAVSSIVRRDPAFREDLFLKRAEKVFYKVQEAWNANKLEEILPIASDGIFERLDLQTEELMAMGVHRVRSDFGLFDARIAQMNSDAQFDTIHVYFHARLKESWYEAQSEKIRFPGDFREIVEYWSFSRKPGTKTLQKGGLLEGDCPNCSAPLEFGKSAKCPICNCYLRSGEYDWVLTGINDAAEWTVVEPEEVPGMIAMKKEDSGFHPYDVTDRSAVVFWRRRKSERLGSASPLARFSSEPFTQAMEGEFTGSRNQPNIPGLAQLDSLKILGIDLGAQMDRIFIGVFWSFIPFLTSAGWKGGEEESVQEFHQEVFILGRKTGAISDEKKSLTSSHCPSCGAPETDCFTSVCEYCNTQLNDANRNWILLKITHPLDPECLNFKNLEEKTVKNVPEAFAQVDSQTNAIAAMIQVMMSDGTIDDNEKDVLLQFLRARGCSQKKFQGIKEAIQKGWIHIPQSKSREEGKEILFAAIRMALADGEIQEKERQTLGILSHHLGFSDSDLNLFIAKYRKRLFEFTKKCSVPTNERVVCGMISIMKADGIVEDKEVGLLMKFAEEHHFPQERLLELMDSYQHNPEDFEFKDKDEAVAIIQACARMAFVDGNFQPDESTVLSSIAQKLGYSPADVNLTISRERAFYREQRRAILQASGGNQ